MIVFELTMPHAGSWNGKWTGADKRYIRTMYERQVPRECWNKDFYYRWDDGWCACVSVKRAKSSEAKKLKMRSSGFCGYDWMVRSIIECGCILTDSERIKNNKKEVK